jgi:hypothetical protein
VARERGSSLVRAVVAFTGAVSHAINKLPKAVYCNVVKL